MDRMIRWLVVGAVTVLLLPAGASAQAAAGFRAGARFAGLDAGSETEGITTFVAGGYFGLGLSDRLALQLELVYGERGAGAVPIADGVLDPEAPSSNLSMTYLDIPVLLRAGFPGERFLPSFFIGPYAGFLLGCEITPPEESARECDSADVTPRFSPRSTDFGIVAGGALDMAIGESTIYLDARYTLGLLGIGSEDDSLDARHNGLEISGGFAFPLGR